MKHFDLFSGYGGFSIACERNGIETIGFSEIDKYASAVLKYHWPNIQNYGDITKIIWDEVPDFDLLTGGSPCQDLSIAGKRKGLAGERSGLFWEYLRAIKEKKPKYFIWENVKGALSSNYGYDFSSVINSFSEAGYSIWWQVLNAKDFGVPQNRERIFVVGFRDQSAPEVFFERASNQEDIRQLNNPTHSNNRLYGDDGISPALNTAQGGNRQPKIPVFDTIKEQEYNGSINNNTNHYDSTKSRRSKEEMSSVRKAINSQEVQWTTGGLESLSEENVLRLGVPQGNNAEQVEKGCSIKSGKLQSQSDFSKDGCLREMSSKKEDGNSSQEREQNGQSIGKLNGDLSRLSYNKTSNRSKEKLLEETQEKQFGSFRIRRLTCKEAERLMGLPDNWLKYGINEKGEQFEVSDSQKYKMAGNGVVVNVVEEIINNIILPVDNF